MATGSRWRRDRLQAQLVRLTRPAAATLLAAAAVALPASASAAGSKPGTGSAPGAGPAALGAIGVQLLDAPVSAGQDPRARLYIIDHLHPGTTIRRRIEVTNTSSRKERVVLYPAAATIGHGAFVGAAGHTRNELSTWTAVRPVAAKIPAGGHTIATVVIAVPSDAAPGERYGVVWAEARSVPPGGVGITQVSRVGIRLYLSVGAGGPPAAKFEINSLSARRTSAGRPIVVAAVHNTGGRALDISGALQLSEGPGELRAGPFPAHLGVTLGTGDTEPVTIALDKRLPAGPWEALVRLHSGLVQRSSRATITFPTPTASSFPTIVIAGLVAALLLLGATAIRVLLTRRAAAPRMADHRSEPDAATRGHAR